jgi:hypothetical protein
VPEAHYSSVLMGIVPIGHHVLLKNIASPRDILKSSAGNLTLLREDPLQKLGSKGNEL